MQNKVCYMCRYFDRYYVKGAKQFDKTKYGKCCKKKENVFIHDGCECYEIRPKRNRSVRLVKCYLNDLLTELSSIRSVMEAESDNENE